METNAREQRGAFVRAFHSGLWSMTELCERFRISRPTGYKWVARWQTEGDAGLEARSSAPHRHPQQTDARLEQWLVAARQQYGWGAGKLLHLLQRRHPQHAWPTRSTGNAILDRHGLLRKQRRRRRWPHPEAAPLLTSAPNQVWPADFKGQFKTRDGAYCYPLTVTDHFSRAVLLCRGLPSPRTREVRAAFLALFREIGLPAAIRTDNGAPFASTARHGLTPLNVWWMQLGIVHQRIRPGHPQANGTHERMHRELKRETAMPPATTARAQQRRFEAFRRRYNEERPHEALQQQCPATVWTPSSRPYPARLAGPEYPERAEVRRIRASGNFTFRGYDVFSATRSAASTSRWTRSKTAFGTSCSTGRYSVVSMRAPARSACRIRCRVGNACKQRRRTFVNDVPINTLSAQCSVLSARCSVLGAQCSVPSAQCSVLSAEG